MIRPRSLAFAVTTIMLATAAVAVERTAKPTAQSTVRSAKLRPVAKESAIERGRKLAIFGGCVDCHTPGALYGAPDFSRQLSGSELGWTDQGWTGGARNAGLTLFRFVVYKDPNWDADKFNFETDVVRAEADGEVTNALDPNLKAFFDRGGKLIQYHGWADPQISPGNSVQYYKRVLDANGGVAKVQASHRLFMAPGMGHCGGGEGPNTFDMMPSLEQWVEKGQAPARVEASHSTSGTIDRTRPLCPYPQVAHYKESGSIDSADSFVCQLP